MQDDYEITVANNGEKALRAAFAENKPDLILLDVMMPGIDGYEVCRRLKANAETEKIPVIFITGKVSEQDEIKGFEVGAIDYITKPFSLVVIKSRVRTHLSLKITMEKAEKNLLIAENSNRRLMESIRYAQLNITPIYQKATGIRSLHLTFYLRSFKCSSV